MTAEQIAEVLKKHTAWLYGSNGGMAYLRDADLRNADLTGADLRNADLTGADLRNADLTGADLRNADLTGANLRDANLRGANLRDADLWGANLRNADLRNADLRNADLRNADLSGAYLWDADLTGARLPHFSVAPEEGSFTAFKRVRSGLVVLEVPAEARRVSSLVGRKIRVEYARVVSGHGFSLCDPSFEYREGGIVRPDFFNDDIRIECAPGIHCFITRREAEEWMG